MANLRRVLMLLSIVWLATAGPVAAAFETQAPAMQVVTGARIAAVADRVARRLVTDPDREVQAAYALSDQRVPAGELKFAVEPAQVTSSYVAVPVAITVDGKPSRTVFAGYRIVTYVHTAVAAHDLTMGALLSGADVTIARLPSNGRPAVETASLIGRRLNMSVSRGVPLYAELTRVNELVHAGQPVVYVIHDGPVMLAADVVARTGGGLGETVAIYNPVTRKALSGTVTGPGKVEYTLPGGEEVK